MTTSKPYMYITVLVERYTNKLMKGEKPLDRSRQTNSVSLSLSFGTVAHYSLDFTSVNSKYAWYTCIYIHTSLKCPHIPSNHST